MKSKILILSVGKIPAEYQLLFSHYYKMLSRNLSIHEIVIKAKLKADEAKIAEEKAILSKIPENHHIILLDVLGKEVDTNQFAKIIDNSLKPICFIIGGAYGVSEKVKKRADLEISFSKLTFPHMLARIILIEQIYRAKTLMEGHPYHKA